MADELLTRPILRREFVARAAAIGGTAAVALTGADSALAQLRAVSKTPFRIESAWGSTPKVLTTWKFKVVVPRELREASLHVTGTGKFLKGTDGLWWAEFNAPGENAIRVTATTKTTTKTTRLVVVAKDANLYARVGSSVRGVVTLGCPACPHHVTGVFQTGASDLLLGGLPAVYVGSQCSFAPSCGSNVSSLADGDREVLYRGKALGVQGSPVGEGSASGHVETI